MLHVRPDGDNADDIEALAKSVGVLRYAPPANPCAGCGMPTGGVFCTDCTTNPKK